MLLVTVFHWYGSIYDLSVLLKTAETNKEIYRFLEEYYDRYTGIYLKSRKTLKATLSLLKE